MSLSLRDLPPHIAKSLGLTPVKRPKYGATRTVVDGRVFDSAREAAVIGELQIRARLGEIDDLRLQPEFLCFANGRLVTVYRADACWRERGELVVCDIKSRASRTRIYLLKKKLVRACFGVEIVEIF